MTIDELNLIVGDIFFVSYKETDEKWSVINRINEQNYLIVYAMDGKSIYEIGGNQYNISKGDILFFDKGQAHSAYSNTEDPWKYITVAFKAKNLNLQDFPLITHVVDTNFYKRLFKNLNFEWTAKKNGYQMCCRAIVSELLCYLLRENEIIHKKSFTIETVRQYIAENYEKNFNVEELSAMAGISTSHFHRMFKEHTGFSAIHYLNTIRINKAIELMQSGGYNSIAEIAYDVGFNDIYYFSRLFKKITGFPPSQIFNKKTTNKIQL